MKTILSSVRNSSRIDRPGRALLAATLFPAALALAEESSVPPPETESKPFLLFMGADIDLQQGRDLYRVTNVAGDAFVIMVDGKPVEVLMNRGKLNLRVDPELKLSDKTAVVSRLKVERGYTPPNNPRQKFAAANSGSAAQSMVGVRAGQMASAIMGAQLASERGANLAGGQTAPLSGGSAGPQVAAYEKAVQEAGSDMNNTGYSSAQMQEELDKQLFDAALVTCEVAAPRPVQDPYLVVVAYYREREGNGAMKSRIFARALERLDETPVKVRILQGDFPFGYELLRTAVHVYSAGQELGTNVANKGVALTRDEAHEYLIIDHLTVNKGMTVPPALAFGVNDWDVQPHYNAEQVQQVVYVKVTKGGLPRGAFRDAECSRHAGDPYLEQLIEQVRFKPALKEGKPVDGVAKLTIADLAI